MTCSFGLVNSSKAYIKVQKNLLCGKVSGYCSAFEDFALGMIQFGKLPCMMFSTREMNRNDEKRPNQLVGIGKCHEMASC